MVQFCAGESSTLSTSSDYASYQWYEGDGAIDGATSSSYTANASEVIIMLLQQLQMVVN